MSWYCDPTTQNYNHLLTCYWTVHIYVVIHFWVVRGPFEWKQICAGFLHLFIYVLPLEIQLSRWEGWDPIKLSQAMIW